MASYLDQYGAGEERRNRIILRSILGLVGTVITVSLLWYLFLNHHQESVVKSFLAAVKRKDYEGAYRIWGCTPQKPCSGYEYARFLEDWGPEKGATRQPGDVPDLNVLGLTDSEECNAGVMLTVQVSPSRVDKLWVNKDADEINFSPYPICPHQNPYAIMAHRTLGKLRKILLH